ncbi:unnamed protein product [Oppiella nova]|uniref:Peptidase S1 domain-containing protein n=1 Tax=Oppiella nova TaxID=334625 RepID=A0A7R9QAA5_9ACAR|nr:unnamed protein product [Oppiella nova]CAG2161747.1 unnamed protein product [Oppiella nova]
MEWRARVGRPVRVYANSRTPICGTPVSGQTDAHCPPSYAVIPNTNSCKSCYTRPTTHRKRSENEVELLDMLYPAAYRIVMGNSVRVGQIPWMCSIYYRGHFVCGGSIIDNKHVITAAHCFDNSRWTDYLIHMNCCHRKASDYHIRVGSIRLYNGSVYRVSHILAHERYFQPRIYHDLAIIRCKHDIVFSDEIAPVCLPKRRWLNKTHIWHKIAFVSGFGDTLFGGSQASVLQEVDLNIVNNTYCEHNYKNLIESGRKYPIGMKRSIICAGYEEGGKDACQGDSGGPLTAHFNSIAYLLGVVSFGFQCAQPYFPGIGFMI